MYNRVDVIGYLAANAEVRAAGAKKAISFRVATTKKWKDAKGEAKEKTNFIKCVLFVQSDGVAKYLEKGKLVHVTGEWDETSYEKDGQKRYQTQILVEPFGGLHLLERKSGPRTASVEGVTGQDVEGQEVPEGDDIPF